MGLLVDLVESAYAGMGKMKAAAAHVKADLKERFPITEYFNPKMAKKGALIGFVVDTAVNLSGGWPAALFAGVKQASYTYVTSGFNSKFCEYIATHSKTMALGMLTAALVVPFTGFGPSYLMHAATGTPHPFLSAFWPVPFNMILYAMDAKFFYKEKHRLKFDAADKFWNYWQRKDFFGNGEGNGRRAYRPTGFGNLNYAPA